MLTEEEMAAWQTELDALHARIGRHFRRAEVRARAKRYLSGLLERVERKNGWQLAEHLGETGPQGVQRLLNAAEWDVEAVRDDLRDYVVAQLGDPRGVLIVDETGFLKKGTKSVGVQRQYSGTAGRIENCQVGVFLAYATTKGHAFLDRALYLPQEWADDAARREEAGVPATRAFATKPALARQLLAHAFAADVPAAWVTGDEIYGDDTDLRRWLEAEGHPYVLAVSASHPLWHDGTPERADALVAALPADAWVCWSAGAGSQGERLYDWVGVRLPFPAAAGQAQWLLARRSLSDPTRLAYYRAYGPAETTLATLVRVAGQRWAIEVGFEDAKDLVGLDQYKGRKWTAGIWGGSRTAACRHHLLLGPWPVCVLGRDGRDDRDDRDGRR